MALKLSSDSRRVCFFSWMLESLFNPGLCMKAMSHIIPIIHDGLSDK
jgi:hypothetical protein